MRAVIPFKKSNAKSRLSPLLTDNEREDFAMAMLSDVTGTLADSGCFDAVDVLTTSIIDIDGSNVVLADKGLNEALNEYLKKMSSHLPGESVLIIMADLPLVSIKNIRDMTERKGDVVIAPGRMGGTNALFIREPSRFHVDYYGASFLKHQKIAQNNSLSVEIFDSFNLSTDVDEVADLAEVLLHGKGRAADFLRDIGFILDEKRGRVGVKRK